MRRITVWILSTISILVLLVSYRTSTNQTVAEAVTPTGTNTGSASSSTSAAGATATPGSGGSGGGETVSPSTAASGTFTGTAVATRYGPVQVQITVEDGRVTAAQAVRYPNSDRRDQEINSRAVPQLNAEAVNAQSSRIDMISGATYTSTAYIQSLQAALDQANL